MGSTLQITLDQEEINQRVSQEVQRLLPHYIEQLDKVQPISIDLKKMRELTGLSESALREHVLRDPRIQQHELRFVAGKRLWDWEGFRKEYRNIARNNDFIKM